MGWRCGNKSQVSLFSSKAPELSVVLCVTGNRIVVAVIRKRQASSFATSALISSAIALITEALFYIAELSYRLTYALNILLGQDAAGLV